MRRDAHLTVGSSRLRDRAGDGHKPDADFRLVTARELAEYLGVSPAYVYAHSHELGARRLGSGPKARLRFSIADVDAALLTSCSDSRESPVAKPHPRVQCPQPGELVPIRRARARKDAA